MDDKKIHITVTDEETRNAVTYRFDTWGEVAEFAKEKIDEEKDDDRNPATKWYSQMAPH